MEKLSMTEVRTVVRACLDDHNPTVQGDALEKRDRWLAEIELGILQPADGAEEALETLTLPPSDPAGL